MPPALDNFLADSAQAIPPREDELEVSLFGPGYGECIVVHLGGGEWMTVDSCWSPKKSPIGLEYLRNLGVAVEKSVRLVVATHWHDDHIRGLSRLVAEAESARLVVSAAMKEVQFLELVSAMMRNVFVDTTGVDEWIEILKTMKSRGAKGDPRCVCPILAVGERRIFQRAEDKAKNLAGCEVWSLSPSDESCLRACGEFEAMFPKAGAPQGRLIERSPNHSSVVIWVQCGGTAILLGADLEEVGSANSGWTAVVSSGQRPQERAEVFKIPHHGSANGHNDGVWKRMLVDGPIGILTPFTHGKTVLPTPSDVTRIMNYVGKCFATAMPEAGRTQRRRKNMVDRAVLQTVRAIQDVPMSTGHIRLRQMPGQEWKVELFGTAQELH